MQIWAVANQKGGVGKTTTAVALGGLAAADGHRVLLLDLDPHGSLTCYFHLDPENLSGSTFTLFRERQKLDANLVRQLVFNTPYPRLSLIPATTGLATLERQAIGSDGMGLVVSQALAQVWDQFDLAILDCPPQLGVLMVNALAACQRLIIPVQTEFLALKGLERIVHTLNMMRKSRNRPVPYVVVPTLFDRRTQASVSSLRTLRNTHGDTVWPGVVPVDTRLRDASKAGVPPHLFSPDGRGVLAYTSLLHFLDDQILRNRA